MAPRARQVVRASWPHGFLIQETPYIIATAREVTSSGTKRRRASSRFLPPFGSFFSFLSLGIPDSLVMGTSRICSDSFHRSLSHSKWNRKTHEHFRLRESVDRVDSQDHGW